MSDEELNRELAGLCGWKEIEKRYGRDPDEDMIVGWHPPIKNWKQDGSDYVFQVKSKIPNYCTDLNACHEAEKELVKLDKKFGYSSNTNDYPSYRYVSHLAKLVGLRLRKETVISGHKKPDGSDLLLNTWVHASPFETIKLINASAKHRALALLKTLSS